MSVAAKIRRKAIRLANGIVDTMVIIAVLLLLAVGCFAMWDTSQIFRLAEAEKYEIYKPVCDSLPLDQLEAINPDVFGWLTVFGTHIDYPVVQGKDNVKYVNTNIKGQFALSGSIFLDKHCNRDLSDFSNIFYGHHMEKQAMFGEIGLFVDKNYFDPHSYGQLFYNDKDHGLVFFAFVQADAYDHDVFRTNIPAGDEQAYIDLLLSRAVHTRNVKVTPEDKIVLFSTCSCEMTNGRDILIGKITDELYDDPFKKKSPDKVSVDKLIGYWAQLPLWAKFTIIALFLLLLILILSSKKKNVRRTQR